MTIPTKNQRQIRRDEVDAMIEYAAARGLELPSKTAEYLASIAASPDKTDGLNKTAIGPFGDDEGGLKELMSLHRELTKAVAPAVPGALRYIAEFQNRSGPLTKMVPNIRWMILSSFFWLFIFISLSTSDLINSETLDVSFAARSHWEQIIVACFLCVAAAIGASFANLYTALEHVRDGTYDPSQDASYWIRFCVGVIAGYVLAEVIPVDVHPTFSKPLTALLGGFSAKAVYRIMMRLVEAIEAIVKGDAREREAYAEKKAEMRYTEEALREKTTIVKNLTELREKSGLNDEQKTELDKIVSSILKSAS